MDVLKEKRSRTGLRQLVLKSPEERCRSCASQRWCRARFGHPAPPGDCEWNEIADSIDDCVVKSEIRQFLADIAYNDRTYYARVVSKIVRDPLRTGDTVVLRADAIRRFLGIEPGRCLAFVIQGRDSWSVMECSCSLCSNGTHVLVDEGQHIHVGNIFRAADGDPSLE